MKTIITLSKKCPRCLCVCFERRGGGVGGGDADAMAVVALQRFSQWSATVCLFHTFELGADEARSRLLSALKILFQFSTSRAEFYSELRNTVMWGSPGALMFNYTMWPEPCRQRWNWIAGCPVSSTVTCIVQDQVVLAKAELSKTFFSIQTSPSWIIYIMLKSTATYMEWL